MDEPFEIRYWKPAKDFLLKLEGMGLVRDVERKMMKFRMFPEKKGVPFIIVDGQQYYRSRVMSNKKYYVIYHIDRQNSVVTLRWILSKEIVALYK